MSEHGEGSARAGGSPGKGWLSLAGWGFTALLLAHLVWRELNQQEGGGPASPISEKALVTLAFWGPFCAAVLAAICGTWWAWKAYLRREKGSVLWMRNAFLTGLGAALVLAIAVFDRAHFPREWLAAAAVGLLAAVLWVFAYAAYREERRTSSTSSSSRSSSRSHAGAGTESER